MTDQERIDVPKLRRDVLEWLEKNPDETRRGLSLAASAGRNPDVIRDLFRVDKRKPTFATVAGLAEAIGKDVGAYATGGFIAAKADGWLSVTGGVVAGVWREQSVWHRDDWYQIRVENSVEPAEVGLVVEGRSMDRRFPPGTILRCVNPFGLDEPPGDGDFVVIERRQGDLCEVTCKRLSKRADGDWELACESTQPEFQEPIFIGKPFDTESGDFDAQIDDHTSVKFLVVDAYLPLRRRKTRPMPNSG